MASRLLRASYRMVKLMTEIELNEKITNLLSENPTQQKQSRRPYARENRVKKDDRLLRIIQRYYIPHAGYVDCGFDSTKILPIAKEWQQRPLESVYAVVFLDAIHYHVRSEGQIVKKAVYIAIGINLDGKKDVLGMWVGENESAKFWATVLNGLRNRGVEDIFIACTDNLTGFAAAIEAVFPKAEIQNCIIHQLRNSSKYVSYKDLKALMADLKAVYAAVDEPTALDALDTFAERWDKKYPKISQSWRDNWPNLSTYFKYPQEVRRLIYTTNAIEGFNRQLRKVTKAKSVFPTDDSLLKMLYLAMIDITKKWTGRRQDWSMIHAQLAVFFADRMPE